MAKKQKKYTEDELQNILLLERVNTLDDVIGHLPYDMFPDDGMEIREIIRRSNAPGIAVGDAITNQIERMGANMLVGSLSDIFFDKEISREDVLKAESAKKKAILLDGIQVARESIIVEGAVNNLFDNWTADDFEREKEAYRTRKAIELLKANGFADLAERL